MQIVLIVQTELKQSRRVKNITETFSETIETIGNETETETETKAPIETKLKQGLFLD